MRQAGLFVRLFGALVDNDVQTVVGDALATAGPGRLSIVAQVPTAVYPLVTERLRRMSGRFGGSWPEAECPRISNGWILPVT